MLASYPGTRVGRLDPVGSRLRDADEARIRGLRAIETREQLMRSAAAKIKGGQSGCGMGRYGR